MSKRDKLLMLAHDNFLLNADQAINAIDYLIANYDIETTEEGLIQLIDESLVELYGHYYGETL
jgi:hypothetical protein